MATTTLQTLGLDRARPSVHASAPTTRSWRGGSVAPGFCCSTGLVAPTMGNVNEITDMFGQGAQAKRPARHLGTRST